jgi:hypothetical protein
MKIKYIAQAVKWFDKVNGNTYHSVRITKVENGETIVDGFQYGYGEHYRQTALMRMLEAGWITGYDNQSIYSFERENNYPIYWTVCEGTKKACKENGEL